MGFVVLVKFVVNCIHALAWPLFALIYPLCASIRALEIGSSSDTRKLVAYWILFSLIFLFEYSFAKLLEWISFWLYIKLIISFWLVIPNFDGAFYVYEHFLSPCLYLDTKVLVKQLKERREYLFKGNEFESEVKRCVKEDVPEAQEELLVGKVKLQIANCAQNDVTTVKVTERKDETLVKKVNPTEPDLACMENKNSAPKKIEEILETVASSVAEHPEVPVVPKEVQTRICPLCHVKTHSEITWTSHLQGQRHAAAVEKLKARKQASKKAACEAKNQPSKAKVAAASENKRPDAPVQELENNAGGSKSDRKLEQEIMKNKCVERRAPNKWWCTICKTNCNSLHDIQCHLAGRKHLANVG